MGCSIFFKKCQEVDTVSNFVFLGVPNSISEDTVKDIVDEVLQTLEDELIRDDKDYKLTGRPYGVLQRHVNGTVTIELRPGVSERRDLKYDE